MVALPPLVSQFTITGKLEDVRVKSNGRVKYLLLSDNEKDYWIKVPKEQPEFLSQHLKLGCVLKIAGMQKHKIHQGKVEYKAYGIELLAPPTLKQTSDKTRAKVLFCQSSSCWNKGGKVACELLKEELERRQITEQVEIKTTGCLKKCKQAPNVVMLPDKIHYGGIQPQQIPLLIDKHLI